MVEFNPEAPIDIVIPVYQGLAVTRRCLESVLGHRPRCPHEVIVIDDASPEPELADYLNELAETGRLTLLRNSTNQGFVATANRGLALHPDRDVVLLNSDTEVNGDWLDRLARCAHANATFGTVTPFSNNATICSYPRFCEINELPPSLSLAATDNLFLRANAGRWLEIPTAVGFCMYIRRDCLQAVGAFDERAFGLGYGEENDFCMRATRVGWRHALCADTYVYHVGGVSFGERQAQLLAQAQQTLIALHPDYHERIQTFIREDPARPLRMAVDWERALLAPEQALCVLREREDAFARLLRAHQGHEETLACAQRTTAVLDRGLRSAEALLAEAQDELRQRDQALVEAQRYVREREADITLLKARMRSMQDELMAQLEILRAQNLDLTAQLDKIHASKLWRYTKFFRKS